MLKVKFSTGKGGKLPNCVYLFFSSQFIAFIYKGNTIFCGFISVLSPVWEDLPAAGAVCTGECMNMILISACFTELIVLNMPYLLKSNQLEIDFFGV